MGDRQLRESERKSVAQSTHLVFKKRGSNGHHRPHNNENDRPFSSRQTARKSTTDDDDWPKIGISKYGTGNQLFWHRKEVYTRPRRRIIKIMTMIPLPRP